MRAMNLPNKAGERFYRSAGGNNDAAAEEDLHALAALSQKREASRSSSSIHCFIVVSGISRTGTASAGCRKTPPSRSSANIMGCADTSSPRLFRISGGRVTVPLLETGIAVMLQYCNTAEARSRCSRDFLCLLQGHADDLIHVVVAVGGQASNEVDAWRRGAGSGEHGA